MNIRQHINIRTAGIAAAAFAMGISVQAQAMDKNTEMVLVGFCKASMENDLIQLRKDIRFYRLDFATVASKVVCNDQPIVSFARTYGADRTAGALINKLHGRPVTEIKDLTKVGDPNWSVSFDVGK